MDGMELLTNICPVHFFLLQLFELVLEQRSNSTYNWFMGKKSIPRSYSSFGRVSDVSRFTNTEVGMRKWFLQQSQDLAVSSHTCLLTLFRFTDDTKIYNILRVLLFSAIHWLRSHASTIIDLICSTLVRQKLFSAVHRLDHCRWQKNPQLGQRLCELLAIVPNELY